jgi:MOSC domain-containing protein YiiM
MEAEVLALFTAPARGAPMIARGAVSAVADGGLEGDRYMRVKNRHTAHYQVTLVESEAIGAFVRDTGLALALDGPRRNIVTAGIRLNGLVGKRFRVGDALLEGAELCEPCTLFARRTHREVVKALAGRGGLRARVVEGGRIAIGDALKIEPSPEFEGG